MPASPDPQHPGTTGHTLGPHVVGTRVVVRRLLRGATGPSGGPAMTDLLGVCTAWGDGVCVVQPETGEPVVVALADIVSGKPVPPRPPARLRVDPREAQVRGTALFPDLETEPLGDWVLRRSATATARRANSVLAFGPPGPAGRPEEDEAYERVVAFYESSGQRPIAAVLPGSAQDELFAGHGWRLESHDADTHFQLASVARARRSLRSAHSARWAGADADEVQLEPLDGGSGAGAGTLVTARLVRDGLTAASGVAAYARDWVGFRGIETHPDHRRRGLAVAVMAALLEWGAEQGATTAYLQVLGDNTPALGLYAGLGFTEHHAYRYLAAPKTG